MAGRSIETSVERGHSRRQQLDLGLADRPVFARKVAHHLTREILVRHQVEKLRTSSGTRLTAFIILAGWRSSG
jgi:hypothetical protein